MYDTINNPNNVFVSPSFQRRKWKVCIFTFPVAVCLAQGFSSNIWAQSSIKTNRWGMATASPLSMHLKAHLYRKSPFRGASPRLSRTSSPQRAPCSHRAQTLGLIFIVRNYNQGSLFFGKQYYPTSWYCRIEAVWTDELNKYE